MSLGRLAVVMMLVMTIGYVTHLEMVVAREDMNASLRTARHHQGYDFERRFAGIHPAWRWIDFPVQVGVDCEGRLIVPPDEWEPCPVKW